MKYSYQNACCYLHKIGIDKEKEEYIIDFTGKFLEHPIRGLIYVMHQFYSDDGTYYFYGFGVKTSSYTCCYNYFDNGLFESGVYIGWEISSTEMSDNLAYGILKKITKEDFCSKTEFSLLEHMRIYGQILEKCIESIN